ncbi:hypothetical protein PENSPDRAFT_649730 [Peniophora sp. CONT]|nr:hypothetical protein PENSPDRAFT_649730 [Peniophora sp. CONT]
MTSSPSSNAVAGPSNYAAMSTTRDSTMKPIPSKLFVNLRKSISVARNSRGQPRAESSAMYEQRARYPPRQLQDDGPVRPTVEQIAMGLHLSRTPHLPPHLPSPTSPTPPRLARIESSSSLPAENRLRLPRRHSHRVTASVSAPLRTTPALPPPPSRSALKVSRPADTTTASSPKASLQTFNDSASGSTAPSSIAPPTPTSSSSRFARFSRFIAHRGGARVVSTSQTTSEISVAMSEPVRKSVRFTDVGHGEGDDTE